MNWFLYPLVTALLVFAVETTADAAPSDLDAIAFAKTAFNRKIVNCDSRILFLGQDRALFEISKPRYVVTRTVLTDADQLNGIDYQGQVSLAVAAYRYFQKQSYSWSEWEDPASFNSLIFGLTRPKGASLPIGNEVLIQHKNGKWVILLSTMDDAAEFDCRTVENIEASKENVVQVPGESPKPFKPNAVLNRAYPFKTDCTAAAGTRVMDLGADKALPDFRSVVMDPAVCAPKSHFATIGIVPPDALESIQAWSEHPVDTSSPPVQHETPTQIIPRPLQAAPTVDPSRASLSHNATQTFYTATAVPVYVHGVRGPVLCTVPAHRPVPARMYSRPPQFMGDYGVLAYKADLCPSAANSQPRDLYHESFFRATGAR